MTKENIELFKELIVWAQTQRVAAISVGDMSVTFFPKEPKFNASYLDELKSQENEEDLLFHSSG